MSSVPAASDPREVQIWLFGGLRVRLGARDLGELGRWKRPAALLELLALAPGHALHREQIQDLLWPDLDAEAVANNLHGALHVLRRLMEPGLERGCQSRFLVLQSHVVHLHSPASLWIDVEAFDLAAAAARHTRQPAAYEMALALYTAELLPHDRYVDWIDSHREALHACFVQLLHELAALYEDACDLTAAVGTLERLVAVDPANEDAAANLMRLYTRLGQRQQALRHYHRLHRALQRELDCSPETRLVQLRDAIVQSTTSVRSTQHALTVRERQISGLLTRGLTNRRIADALGVSVRTAETHVSRILRKLDVCSREQVGSRELADTGT